MSGIIRGETVGVARHRIGTENQVSRGPCQPRLLWLPLNPMECENSPDSKSPFGTCASVAAILTAFPAPCRVEPRSLPPTSIPACLRCLSHSTPRTSRSLKNARKPSIYVDDARVCPPCTPLPIALLSFTHSYYLDNVTLANLRLRKRRIAWAQAPSSLWEDPEFSETVRRNLPWHRATS
jgi:hypothetical protein